jgi:plastocyanin
MTQVHASGRPGEPPSPGASRASRLASLAIVACLGLAACTGAPAPTGAPDRTEATQVRIQGFIFRPNELTVPVGTKVTWSNEDEILHTATASDGTFDLEMPEQGTSSSFVFTEAGTYEYACTRHASMTGVLVVE